MAPAPASEHLFTIGQFSRLTDLSCPMLRHYDQLGLLRPSTVDHETGYRYYSPAQLDVAEAIRLLRDLDVPLTEVADILAAPDRECTERLLAITARESATSSHGSRRSWIGLRTL